MVSVKSVEQQLKRLKFNTHSWGRAEIRELPNILMPEEEIYECVNGTYEGGFALLVATDSRVLLIDKKPLNFLTVEDMRFEMINELDYSHRMIGAQISISAGSKTLQFKSYNQARLRKLINHVQHCMADSKKQMSAVQKDQKQHLEQINQQLQAYLIAQHQQQEALREQLAQARSGGNIANVQLPEPTKPSPELTDFLFAQSLLKQFREQEQTPTVSDSAPQTVAVAAEPPRMADLYSSGMQEIFGREKTQPVPVVTQTGPKLYGLHNPLEINPLTIAYSKLPMALRNRKFGRPSFHAHSRASTIKPITNQQFPAI